MLQSMKSTTIYMLAFFIISVDHATSQGGGGGAGGGGGQDGGGGGGSGGGGNLRIVNGGRPRFITKEASGNRGPGRPKETDIDIALKVRTPGVNILRNSRWKK